MGCTGSKAAVVPQAPVTEAWAQSEQEGKRKAPRPISRDAVRSGSGHTTQKDHQESGQKKGVKRDGRIAKVEKETGHPKIMMVQEASEDTQRAVHINDDESIPLKNSRKNSASSDDSETSDRTTDSGLGDEEHARIITEKSTPAMQEIANVPNGLEQPDLTIDGTKLATLIDPFDHRQKMAMKRQASKKEPHTLSKQKPSALKQVTFAPKTGFPDGPNIIKRPSSRGGMAFDVLLEDNGSSAIKREPGAVTRLKKKQKAKQGAVTKEELDEKQERAQQRREELKQQLQDRIQAKREKERQMQEALDKFAARCMEKASKKMDETTENRDAHLQAIRERMKEKSRHAEQVRAAKEAKKHTAVRPPQPERSSPLMQNQ